MKTLTQPDSSAWSAHRMHKLFAVCCSCAALCGCAGTDKQSNGYQTRSYFGWVNVQEKLQEPNDPVVERITTLGLRMGPGFGLGYLDDTRVQLPLHSFTPAQRA